MWVDRCVGATGEIGFGSEFDELFFDQTGGGEGKFTFFDGLMLADLKPAMLHFGKLSSDVSWVDRNSEVGEWFVAGGGGEVVDAFPASVGRRVVVFGGKIESVKGIRLMAIGADDGVVGFDYDVAPPALVNGVDLGEEPDKVIMGDGFLPKVESLPIGAGTEVGEAGVMAAGNEGDDRAVGHGVGGGVDGELATCVRGIECQGVSLALELVVLDANIADGSQ